MVAGGVKHQQQCVRIRQVFDEARSQMTCSAGEPQTPPADIIDRSREKRKSKRQKKLPLGIFIIYQTRFV